ncbi:phage-related tail fiber protein-like protein [Enterobacter hormaechei]|uniref:phage tail protein n=1 Tax=Enterobacter hormaechei TaxID=158836 RepID=UPI000795E371|nr:phage tail protein [Enterobacter hormaechei]CZW46173.1 phage-related tail fiber protein-like protein [Enterobacter hormaechei]CZW84176.1 phage-related tail fiber protein-like protein [Enterobacter hormaechei]SAC53372.1 phage-related tail fiber protein-like protein [Enterobacter hormaechei]SAG71145.1 phage-related tail fiber protein-like protein [Enterobacter hormaechei]SAH71009.1 phage-related tail fiber protein-like protein [Enterobacter hormaechei]
MSAKFYTLLTDIGAAKLASAAALGVPLKITQMAVGDGGGVLPTPSAQQTALVAEKRRAVLNMLYIDPQNSSQIIAEQVIPETEGGWWIREVGLFDETGALIAVGNCPESYKPQLAEGSGRTQTVRMVLITSSTDNITLKIDPSVVLATRKYVDDKVLELKVYVDDLMAKHIAANDPHTQYAPKESPTLTGTPKAPTAPAGTNTTQIASTAFVQAVVTALNNALALKAPLASPALTGTPTAPTAAQTVNNTQIATTAFVKSAIAALVASSPAALDTLNELAAALGNDPNFATTMTNALAGKQPLDSTLTTLSGKTAAGIIGYLGLVNSSGMVGRLVSIKKFTASGTYTPTAGTRFVKVRLVGAGGAGGGAAASTVSGYLAAGRGGGGGSYGETTLIDVTSVLSVAVIVGSAGVGSAGSSGTAGGSSSFGSYITAPGGDGGGMGASGPANNSLVSDLGNSGKECTGTDIFISIPGEGGGGQMSLSTGTAKGGHGGSSILGTGGSAYTANQQGGYGWGFGAGGAGSITVYAQGASATAGGHGSNGIVIIEEYA